MRKTLFLLAASFVAGSPAFAQKKGVYISESVLPVAQAVQMDYKGAVKKASAKDAQALRDLLEFSRLVDGAALADHMQTCLELIPAATDAVYAKTVEGCSPGLKTFLLKQLPTAQQRTQKEALRKPIQEWAPYTWEALNGREVVINQPSTTQKTPAPAHIDAAQLKKDGPSEQKPAGALAPAPDATQGNQLAPAGGRRGNE